MKTTLKWELRGQRRSSSAAELLDFDSSNGHGAWQGWISTGAVSSPLNVDRWAMAGEMKPL